MALTASRSIGHLIFSSLNEIIKSTHAIDARVAGFRLEYPPGFKLECMAGFIGTHRNLIVVQTFPTRRYKDFRCDQADPRFIVTSLSKAETGGRFLYEKIYCARGDAE